MLNPLNFIDANKAWLEHAGFTSTNEIINLNDTDCPWSQHAQRHQHHDRAALAGNIYSMIHPTISANEQFSWLYMHKYPEYSDCGQVQAIQTIAHHTSPPIWGNRHTQLAPEHIKTITRTEQKILLLLLYGKTAKRIAIQLNRSVRTIESHINNLKTKLNCRCKSDIIEYAINHGYFTMLSG